MPPRKGVETEIKLPAGAPAEARQALAALGADLVRVRHFEDNVLLDHPLLQLFTAGATLRLRRAEGRGWLTYKGPRHDHDGLKSRPEVETMVGDADGLQAVLESLGFRPAFRYQKYRETYRWGEAEIVLDETPLGTFIEVEGPPSEIHRAAAALGHPPEHYIRDSYVGLWVASGKTGDMVFRSGESGVGSQE